MTSERWALALAGVGAVAVLLGFLGTLVQAVGALVILGASAFAGVRLLRTGGVICAIGVAVSLLFDTIGGLTAAIGAAIVVVAVAFAWPTSPPPRAPRAP